MSTLSRSLSSAAAVLLASTQVSAQADQCADQLISRGNNVTGRTLAVSREYPGVPASTLFEALHSALSTASDKLGAVQITRSDPARRVLSGLVTPAGAARPVSLEVTVAVLPNGGAQISFTNRLPAAMFVSSRQWAVSNCAFLASVVAPGGVPETAPEASVRGVGSASTSTPRSESRVASEGLAYGEVLAGTLSVTEEIDRFRLRNAASGDTVQMWMQDPRERQAGGSARWYHSSLKTSLWDRGATRTLEETPGGLVILRGSGPFELRVETESGAVPYQVKVIKWTGRPEHVGSAIATADTIRGEGIDYPGDTDEFLFNGGAGEEIQVYLGDHRSLTYDVKRRRPGARDEDLPRGSAGIIRLPADGMYVLVVRVAFLTTEYNMTGPYWFRVRRRN